MAFQTRKRQSTTIYRDEEAQAPPSAGSVVLASIAALCY